MLLHTRAHRGTCSVVTTHLPRPTGHLFFRPSSSLGPVCPRPSFCFALSLLHLRLPSGPAVVLDVSRTLATPTAPFYCRCLCSLSPWSCPTWILQGKSVWTAWFVPSSLWPLWGIRPSMGSTFVHEDERRCLPSPLRCVSTRCFFLWDASRPSCGSERKQQQQRVASQSLLTQADPLLAP